MAAPTRAKIRLGKFLSELRNRADVTVIDAAAELRTTDVTVYRYESGQVLPVWASVSTFVNFYGASDDERARALELWEYARDEPKSVRLPGSAPKSFRRLVNAEREAPRERAVAPYVVPALLQTESYTRALVDAAFRFHDPGGKTEGVAAARRNRQACLVGPAPIELHVLIDEAAIRRVAGGPEVMREQLQHLLTAGAAPNITIQVIPYSVGAYGTMSGACTIIDYPEQDSVPGVYLEYPTDGAWVDNADDVKRFTTMFDDVITLALSPADTAVVLRQQIGALEDR